MIRIIRRLRIKHGISYAELRRVTGISEQRFSQIELDPNESTQYQKIFMKKALNDLLAKRKEAVALLETDLARCSDRLLDFDKGDLTI